MRSRHAPPISPRPHDLLFRPSKFRVQPSWTTVQNHTWRTQNPDIPRARRVGAHGGAAGRGRAGTPTEQFDPKTSKTRPLTDSPEAQKRKTLCKPMEGKKTAVYLRFDNGVVSALCSWLPDSGPTPFCLCKPFSCTACPGMQPSWTTVQNHKSQ